MELLAILLLSIPAALLIATALIVEKIATRRRDGRPLRGLRLAVILLPLVMPIVYAFVAWYPPGGHLDWLNALIGFGLGLVGVVVGLVVGFSVRALSSS